MKRNKGKGGRRIRIIVVMMMVCAMANAQKNDYVWLAGYDSWAGYDSFTNHSFGTTVLDFNYSPLQIRYDSLSMNFDATNTSYCDNNGNLLFYSNGIYVANALDEKIENGDSLNAGAFQYWWDPTIQQYGYRAAQAIFAFQSSANSNLYYLLHTYLDTISPGQLYVRRLYYTLLDMAYNGGHGKVIAKNQTIIESSLGAEMAVIRHGNGKDWWILVQKRNSNCYYKVLLTPNGPELMPTMECGGNSTLSADIGAFAVSPDGNKLVYHSLGSGVNIFDFDRCNGELSNAVSISIPGLIDSGYYNIGAAISPNNRFLYLAVGYYVFQYDLLAANISASVDTVAKYDGSRNPIASGFHTMQLAPDGKIYESCGNSEYVYHVINRPDEKGDSCLFIQHGIQLPSFCGFVPSFPNYRLGALPGSPCDTLTGLTETARAEKEKILKVFPNPASDLINIDYGFTDWSKSGDMNLVINDEPGRIIYEQSLPRYSGFQKINISSFAAGVYYVAVKRAGVMVAVAKFVKE